MSVKYEEDAEGVYWVDGNERGTSQKNLHAAMDDYGKASNVHTSTEEADHRPGDEGTGRPEGQQPGEAAADPGTVGTDPEGEDDPSASGEDGVPDD